MSATMQPVAPAMGGVEWAMLVALSLLWGGSFFFTGIAVADLPPVTLVALRVSVAAIVLWAVLCATRQHMPWPAYAWLAFLGMGLLNNVLPFTLIVWGQNHIASVVAAILNATTPLFTAIAAHLLTRDEKLTVGKTVGVAIGLAGAVVTIGADALVSLGQDMFAQLACLGAAFSYALASIFGRRFRRMGIPPLATATGQVTASAMILLPLSVLIEHPWTLPMPGAATWGAVLGIGILSTAAAYILFFRILAAAGALNLMLVTFLIPVSATVLGVTVLGETLLMRHVAGMATIGIGMACIDGRLFRWAGFGRRNTPPLPASGTRDS